jgi:hypothetical protein
VRGCAFVLPHLISATKLADPPATLKTSCELAIACRPIYSCQSMREWLLLTASFEFQCFRWQNSSLSKQLYRDDVLEEKKDQIQAP